MHIQLTKKQKEEIVDEALKELFNAVTTNDFLFAKNGKLHIGNKELTKEQTESLKTQANTILHLELYELLIKQIQIAANRRMFEHSQSWEDMIFGKAVLYVADLMTKKLKHLSDL